MAKGNAETKMRSTLSKKVSGLMHYVDVPETINSISPGWLTHSLRQRWPEIDVTGVTAQLIGRGQWSAVSRLTLQHSGAPNAPRKVVVKLHAPLPEAQEVASRYRMYEREANFYKRLANDVPIRTPDVYYSGLIGYQRFVLLMEDMSDWSLPDLLEGPSEPRIELAITQLAKLTAAFWDSPRLEAESSWLPDWDVDYMRITEHYRACLPEFLKRFGEVLPAGGSKAANAIADRLDKLTNALNTGTRVLTHFDFRADNMFFLDSDPDAFCLIDWAIPMRSRPGFDLAYLMGTSVPVDTRRQRQKDYIDLYHASLQAEGIQDYSRATLDRDIDLNSMLLTLHSVVAGAVTDMSVPRNVELLEAMAKRAFSNVLQNDCLDSIPA